MVGKEKLKEEKLYYSSLTEVVQPNLADEGLKLIKGDTCADSRLKI